MNTIITEFVFANHKVSLLHAFKRVKFKGKLQCIYTNWPGPIEMNVECLQKLSGHRV